MTRKSAKESKKEFIASLIIFSLITSIGLIVFAVQSNHSEEIFVLIGSFFTFVFTASLMMLSIRRKSEL